MKENQRRNAEALEWIQSLSLNGEEQNTTIQEYLRGNGSPSKGSIVNAYKHRLLKCGLSKWIRNHKLKLQRDLKLLEQEVNVSLRAQKRKSRMCIEQWIDYVSFQQLRVYSARRTELKLSIGMQYRYKLRTCLHYWKLRVRVRQQLKTRLFSLWKQMSRGRLVVKLVCFQYHFFYFNVCRITDCMYLSDSARPNENFFAREFHSMETPFKVATR